MATRAKGRKGVRANVKRKNERTAREAGRGQGEEQTKQPITRQGGKTTTLHEQGMDGAGEGDKGKADDGQWRADVSAPHQPAAGEGPFVCGAPGRRGQCGLRRLTWLRTRARLTGCGGGAGRGVAGGWRGTAARAALGKPEGTEAQEPDQWLQGGAAAGPRGRQDRGISDGGVGRRRR